MKHTAPIVAVLMLVGCATHLSAADYDVRYAKNLVTVPRAAAWTLIGEWDYPGKIDNFMNYTTSIVRFNGTYVEVHSGQVVTGCCYWPQGTRLKQLAEDTFSSPVDGSIYRIRPDRSLEITKSGGVVVTAKLTAPEDSLARSWEK
jgi:hypothetical protein